jgi:NAD+ diphosphatase
MLAGAPVMSAPPNLGPKPRLGYTPNPLERVSERRGDTAYMEALEAAPAADTYVVAGENIVLKRLADRFDPLFSLPAARTFGVEETVLLGVTEGHGRFGIGINPAHAADLKAREDLFVTDLRTLAVQGMVSADDLAALAEAKAMLSWHARHRFCSVCGTASRAVEAGWRRDCPACGASHFPRTDPVVIMLAVDGERCLLGRQARFPPGMWSCLAGFVEPGESIEAAVRREIQEEAGIVCGPVTYVASQPWPFPMSLMIGCHTLALSQTIRVDKSELEDARWFDREQVTAMLLRRHPQGLGVPPPIAIAYHLIRAWVEEAPGRAGTIPIVST